MLRNWIISLAFCFLHILVWMPASALDEIKVTAEINQNQGFENYPLAGTITVTHTNKDSVDLSSFRLENKPFKVDFIKIMKMPASNLQVSLYHFELPGKSGGLYILPEITVKVGRETYKSIPTTYEVLPANKAPISTSEEKTATELKLEASINGPTTLYPGQRFWIVYRFYYNGDIELIKEELPLLNPEGFLKVGDKSIKDYHENDATVQEISLQVQAAAPGEYNFPASVVEGYAYKTDPIFKKRTYLQPKLHSEAPSMTIVVNPFPAAGKPSTFQGAVGQFTFETALLTSSTAAVEEKMLLALDISSRDAILDTITMPKLSQQPGLKGLFRFSDLPPVGKIDGTTKRFIAELYPLTPSIKEIPAIEFSYFDPLANHYETLRSDPIPITVVDRDASSQKQNAVAPPPPQQEEKQEPISQDTKAPIAPVPPVPIEISSNEPLDESDLFHKMWGTWKIVWIIPLGTFFILLLIAIRLYLKQQKQQQKYKGSVELWREAMEQPPHSSQFFTLLQQAFLTKLWEKGVISSPNIPINKLPSDNRANLVRTFFNRIEEQRFASGTAYSQEQILQEAQELFTRLDEGT